MQSFSRFWLAAGALMAVGGGVAVTVAQDKMAPVRPEATIYRDVGFNGPAVAISDSNPDLGLAWAVNAIRVRAGVWQLCEQRNFRGRCRTYNSDTPMLGSIRRGVTVQSIRLLGGGSGGGGWQSGELARDQTVRGNFAQFHTQPATNGYRVESCPGGNASSACMKRNSDAFCRATGWNGSGKAHQETVNRRVYLADVLCVRTGY